MAWFHDAVRDLSGSVAADLFETEDTYLLVVDLPGATPEDTSVTTGGGALRIVAAREKSYPPDAELVSEERPSTLEIELPLPDDVEADGTSASLSDGVLEIELPRGDPHTKIPIERE